jgi:hypothetical protein
LLGWLCKTSRYRPSPGSVSVTLSCSATRRRWFICLFYFGLPAIGVHLSAFVYAMLHSASGRRLRPDHPRAHASVSDDQDGSAKFGSGSRWRSSSCRKCSASLFLPPKSGGLRSSAPRCSVIAVPELTYQLRDHRHPPINISRLQYGCDRLPDSVQILNQGLKLDRRWFGKWRSFGAEMAAVAPTTSS